MQPLDKADARILPAVRILLRREEHSSYILQQVVEAQGSISGLHDVDFLSLGEVKDFFGSWTNYFVILADRQQGIVPIHISIRQHHGGIVLIHHVS